MIKSIAKGKNFERLIAKRLTKLTKTNWKRVPMSGAFSTVNRSKDKRFFGDVFTETKLFSDIVVECKKTKAPITIFELLNPKARLFEWINQTKRESKGQKWILIFSWNHSKIFYITPFKSVVQRLNLKNSIIIDKNYFGLLK